MKENDFSSDELHVDFLSGKMRYRLKQLGLRKELLARAMGIHPREKPKIVDATAGLGRDSFILAALGYEVTLIERSSVLYQKLSAAMTRARSDLTIAPIIERMHLVHADSILWLKSVKESDRPDVVYLDPMFPDRKKSASVKKEMVLLQQLLGKDMDHAALFSAAFACAKRRVVVKRPRLAANIVENKPNFSMAGKSSRFDVYLVD